MWLFIYQPFYLKSRNDPITSCSPHTHQLIRLFIHPSIHSPTNTSIYNPLFFPISIVYPFVPPPTHTAMHPFLVMLLFIPPFMRPSSIHPSVLCPSPHASIPSFMYLSTINPFIFHFNLGAVPDEGGTFVETKPDVAQLRDWKLISRQSLRSLATTHHQKACGDKWQVNWSTAPLCHAVVPCRTAARQPYLLLQMAVSSRGKTIRYLHSQ